MPDPTEEKQNEKTGDELFGEFFNEAVGGEKTPTAEETAAEKAAADAKAAEGAAADAKAAEEAAAAEAIKTVDVDAILAQAREAAEKAIADKTAEQERLAAEEAAKKAAEPTAEDIEADKKFREEWPDHAKKMDKLEGELAQIREMLTQQSGKIDPLLENTQEELQRRHEEAIKALHADVFEILPNVEKWIEGQPQIHQGAYNWVLDNGTPTQIGQLLDIYKASTGDADKAAAEKAAAEKAAAEKAKVFHLASPNARRSTVTPGATDKDDFDGAFAEAVNQVKSQ